MSVLARRLVGAEVRIEPMRRRDLRQVMPLESAAYPTSWSRRVFDDELAQMGDGSRHYVVARRGRRVLGYAGLWFVPDPSGDQAHVTNVVVDPEVRRMGIAQRMLIDLARLAIARGCVAWTLEVRASATGAQALYRRFGFAPAGVRKQYYERTEDAIVMWCHELGEPCYAELLDRLEADS